MMCRFEHYLDERLGLFNHGSTLMHILETEKIEKKKLINLLIQGEHSQYLYKYLCQLTTNSFVDENSILLHCREHEDYLNEKEVENQIQLRTQQQERQDIIEKRKRAELDKRNQQESKIEFINVIAEDEDEDKEETNIDGVNMREQNEFWDNQYNEFVKKQEMKIKAETEVSLHKISMGNMQVDGIKNINKNL